MSLIGTQDYQVGETDHDLLTLAAKLNVDYNKLKQANPTIKSISEGQFISVPVDIAKQFTGRTPGNIKPVITPTGSFIGGGGTVVKGVTPTTPKPPKIPDIAQQYANQYISSMQQASMLNPQVYHGANSFVGVGGQVPTAEIQFSINQQVASGVLPNFVPTGTSIINPETGIPVTQAEMQANGYKYNNFTKGWELGGSGEPPATSTTANGEEVPTPAYLQIINYNGNTMPAWKAELMAKRAARKSRQRLKAAQQPIVEQRDDTAGTTLNLRLGS